MSTARPLPVDDVADPRVVLRIALARHPDLVVVSSLGPQTLVVVHLLHALGARAPVLLIDTGLLFPETLALRWRLQARYGVVVHAVRPALDLEAQEALHGPALWTRDPERCCALRKVAPLDAALAGRTAWVTGLRASQGATRADVGPFSEDPARPGVVKVNPLWAWSEAQVRAFLVAHRVPYNPLLDQGYRSVGCAPCTSRTPDGADERAGRWLGRAKTECGLHLPPGPAPRRPVLSLLPPLTPEEVR